MRSVDDHATSSPMYDATRPDSRVHHLAIAIGVIVAIVVFVVVGCGDTSSNAANEGKSGHAHLAGGGTDAGDAPTGAASTPAHPSARLVATFADGKAIRTPMVTAGTGQLVSQSGAGIGVWWDLIGTSAAGDRYAFRIVPGWMVADTENVDEPGPDDPHEATTLTFAGETTTVYHDDTVTITIEAD